MTVITARAYARIGFMGNPSDGFFGRTISGRVHSTVKEHYHQQDPEVIQAMQTLGEYALTCKFALLQRDYETVGECMNKNFDLRRRIYGDAVLGEKNLKMIAIARRFGCPVKFAGSSGSVIGMYRTEQEFQQLAQAYQAQGFHFSKVSIDPGPVCGSDEVSTS